MRVLVVGMMRAVGLCGAATSKQLPAKCSHFVGARTGAQRALFFGLPNCDYGGLFCRALHAGMLKISERDYQRSKIFRVAERAVAVATDERGGG